MSKLFVLFCAFIVLFSTSIAQEKLNLTWRAQHALGQSNQFELIIKNRSTEDFSLQSQTLWFNSLHPVKEKKTSVYSIRDMTGNLYCIDFSRPLIKSDSIVIPYQTAYPLTHISMVPNGFYLQNKNATQEVIALKKPVIIIPERIGDENRQFLANLYDKNKSFESKHKQLILPTPAQIEVMSGELVLSGEVGFYLDHIFINTVGSHFQELALSFPKTTFYPTSKAAAKVIVESTTDLEESAYQMKVSDKGIHIKASHSRGAFYALQSLKNLLPADYLTTKAEEIRLPYVDVLDKPRYGYRGLMLDISRNFKDLAVLKKYIDVMALYKLNTLHLHLIDDEGWRLEIPSIPELTEIGASRTPFFQDGNSIQPSYGSGAKPLSKQYLTTGEFKELLKYANSRFITVIPELETPGHARASVKAMEQRYHRLMEKGQKEEAERFLMNDFADTSTYTSAQYWRDNVMNPAMPGTYRFIATILSEIKEMYNQAGVPLERISIGGDELPHGAWEGSPRVQNLMKEQNMRSVHEVWPYYIEKVNKICQERGLALAGWEEVGMVNKGKGMVVNEELSNRGFQLDVWNNTIGGGQEDLAYKLANAGYKVVFTSASNYYFDMVWDADFSEPGLNWASQTDLYHAYSLIPESYFANIMYTERGKPLGKEYFDKKVRLSETGKKNLLGLKGALWAETIQSNEDMDYMIFPRLFALAERSWAPERPWESDDKFDKKEFDHSYAAFRQKISEIELPKLENFSGGFNYRLPAVGIKESNGKLHVNTEYTGATVLYTTDGTTPTRSSTKFPAEGIRYTKGQVIKAVAVSNQGRIGTRVSTYSSE